MNQEDEKVLSGETEAASSEATETQTDENSAQTEAESVQQDSANTQQEAQSSGENSSDESDNQSVPEPSKDETIASLKTRLVQSEARCIAKEHGVSDKKLPYVVELAKIANIDPDSEDAPQMIRAAVEKVLDDIPEFKMGVGTGGTGSLGNFARRVFSPASDDPQREVAAAMRTGR